MRLDSNSFQDFLQAFEAMTPEERAAARELAEKETGHMLFVPNVGPQTEAYYCLADELFYGGSGGGGKAQSVESRVLTPFGWRRIGSLKVGDKICDTHGGAGSVIGVYPQGVRDLYRIKTHDGGETLACADHIWTAWVSGHSYKRNGVFRTGEDSARNFTTQMLIDGMARGRTFILPTPEPCQFTVAGSKRGRHEFVRRELDPYVLGVLIGDGTLSDERRVGFSSVDDEIVEYVCGAFNQDDVRKEGISYYWRGESLAYLRTTLKKFGLAGCGSEDKFIPRIYLFGSIDERWALLQGLMDTDGWADIDGDTYYCTTSERLRDDVAHLARSLGAIVTVCQKEPTYQGSNGGKLEGRTAWSLRIKLRDGKSAFRLWRKMDRADKEFQFFGRRIVSIEPAQAGEAVCIRVSHPSSLYITDDFIVTHNTGLLCGVAVNEHIDIQLFRREATQLRGLVKELRSIIGNTDGFNRSLNIWHRGEQTIELAGLQHEDDKFDWQGRQADMKGFDEITHFCLCADTEVLTGRGWVKIADVTTSDVVLAMSADKTARYERVTATHVFPYSGDLIGSTHRSVRYWVTPNHKMVVSPQRSDGWRFVEAKDLPDYALYPFSKPWQGTPVGRIKLEVPFGRGIGPNANAATDIDGLDWAEFLGWYLAEGSCFETGERSGPRISIRQTTDNKELDALMQRLPWRCGKRDGEGYYITSRQLFNILKPLGNRYEKRVPRWILDGDVDVLTAFWRGFVAGDGSVRPNGSIAIGLCNEGLRDDCQEIATKLGHRSTAGYQRLKGGFDVFRLNVHGNKNRVVWESPAQRTTKHYEGNVHCLTVEPSHTFLIRVDGRVMWTGNSRSQYQFVIGWNRSTNPKVKRCRVIATGNPPMTAEGLWVIKHWGPWLDETHPDPARPGELRWPVRVTDDDDENEIFFHTPEEATAHLMTLRSPPRDEKGNILPPRSRTFIPARLEDNPDLMRTGYSAVLDAMPKELRDAMRDGKFNAALKDQPMQAIPTQWIVAAQQRWKPDGGRDRMMSAMAFDPAGGGRDEAVLAWRFGDWYDQIFSEASPKTADGSWSASIIAGRRRDLAPVVVDVGGGAGHGFGGTTIMRLKDNEIEFRKFDGNGESMGKTVDGQLRFYNKRAEAWWRMREALDPDQPGGATLALPPDPELRADLAAPTYEATGRGIKIESKKDIKKRLGRSPGKGDAVVMCWSEGDLAILKRERRGGIGASNATLPTQANLGGRQLHADRVGRRGQTTVYPNQSSTYRDEQG